jgi:hypothetical protein
MIPSPAPLDQALGQCVDRLQGIRKELGTLIHGLRPKTAQHYVIEAQSFVDQAISSAKRAKEQSTRNESR